MSTYTPPLKISIPAPSHIPRGRGINSTTSYGGNMRFRCSDPQYDLIQEEAEKAGVTMAAFCRWVCVHTAKALREHRTQEKVNNVGEDYECSSTGGI